LPAASPPAYAQAPMPMPVAHRPITTAKANGLIFSLTALAAALLFLIGSGFLTRDLEGAAVPATQYSTVPSQSEAQVPNKEAIPRGEVPESILQDLDTLAVPQDYAGSYTGRLAFIVRDIDKIPEFDEEEEMQRMLDLHDTHVACTVDFDGEMAIIRAEHEWAENNEFTVRIPAYAIADGRSRMEDTEEEMGVMYHEIHDLVLLNRDGNKGLYALQAILLTLEDGTEAMMELRVEAWKE